MPLPRRQGLYDPAFEGDACGIGLVATLSGSASRCIVEDGLEVLRRLKHRGATGCDEHTGDGAGMLLQIPDALYRATLAASSLRGPLPAAGDYAVAMCFLPREPEHRGSIERVLEGEVRAHGLAPLGWRDVPVSESALGEVGLQSAPVIRQLFVARGEATADLEAALYLLRRRVEARLAPGDLHIASWSSRTVVYKGLLLADRLSEFYVDLADARTASRLALVHSRFSTNTFPSWELAHPFRVLAHNGEINTLRGNRVWLEAREADMERHGEPGVGRGMPALVAPGVSDSAALDALVEFLARSGRSLPHAVAMLMPESGGEALGVGAERQAFLDYHACLNEPWDGPAAVVFSDGRLAGATLDRNGLRPARYVVTTDGLVVLASEFGVLDIDARLIVEKGRLGPGQMLLVDTEARELLRDAELKSTLARRRPYTEWLSSNLRRLTDLPGAEAAPPVDAARLRRLQRAFGYTEEELRLLVAPMAMEAEEPVGSMGIDVPLAVLSDEPQLLFRYFKQHFAQVTNPPIDPWREQLVMSLSIHLGAEGCLLEETPTQARRLLLDHPLLTDEALARLRLAGDSALCSATLQAQFQRHGDPATQLRAGLVRLVEAARQAVVAGASILVISDRDLDEAHAAIPSLLALGAVHRALLAGGRRPRASLVVETAEAREVAHVALLLGYGAAAVNPYLALASAAQLAADGLLGAVDAAHARANLVKALVKGLLKVMSKMGISTLSSYCGAQIFEAVGLDEAVVEEFFAGTASRVRGIGLEEIAGDVLARHAAAFDQQPAARLPDGGVYQYRVAGERHLWSPEAVAALQKAVRLDSQVAYDEFAKRINDGPPVTLRALWELRPGRPPVTLDEVEPAATLLRRFATGAMSFGSLSKEAHENLAIAMNRLGARSNSGEGGEDPERDFPDARGDSRRSAIRQVASARFGVTLSYLVHADELQIKIAQGAKPGEGGQLPGRKVDAAIARVRHAMPGITLVSPPPHHDIYSIEDLAQLIFDLKSVNPRARVSVKLVAEAGIGVIAAGVAKAGADAILVSGHDGGTGASPLTSIHHAGLPWEIGLSEVQQVLSLNGLRGRVRLQVDGQLRTGRDVVMAALLGAEEFGFATGALVASGCIMMRKCHLNTCPVGIATQDPELRRRFAGTPEHVINYFFFVAEEARRLMAQLGFKQLDEMVGRADCIEPRRMLPSRLRKLDFSEVLYRPELPAEAAVRCREGQSHDMEGVLDHLLIERAEPALTRGEAVAIALRVRNADRAIGAMLSGEVERRRTARPLADDTIVVRGRGSAGQSFGAFLAKGVTLALEGDANDYVGKGLSGGIISIAPPQEASFRACEQTICGNTVLYGATSGRLFVAGQAGERFAVRNSGATAVVEGVGDHGCEYMTGGLVLVLGVVGRNFGAGMSGGRAFVADELGDLPARCHPEARGDLARVTSRDLLTISELLREHAARTGSARAREWLGRGDELRELFWTLVPREYRRAEGEAAAREASERQLRAAGG
jgi:glutamate synthase (NADPH) large chain